MKSNKVILLVAGAILAISADATSLTYKHFYDDDYSEDDTTPQQPPPSFKEQEYYVDEEGAEGGVVEEEEEEYRGRETADYEAEGEFPRRVYDEVTPPTPPTHDPLDDARRMAVLNIMDRLLIALGPTFGETLPKAPTNNTLATVPTPINITAEPCPYKYKRCSSQTSFPSCDIPHNTDPEVWSQRFNLYFNLSADFDKMDIINATLRLYKNNSIPLHYPKSLLIKAYAYSRSLTRRRSRTMLVAEKSVLSDYIGWVTLSVDKIVRRWRKARNNHGLLITVTDADTIPWDASSIFVIMSCSSGNNSLVPLPFEVQTDEVGQRYPALNIRQGSPDDEFPVVSMSRAIPSPRPAIPIEAVTGHIQSDDPEPYVYEDEYDFSQSASQRHNIVGEHPVNPHSSHPFATGGRRAHLPNTHPYVTGLMSEDSAQAIGHAPRSGHEHVARGSSRDTSYSHGAPHREISGNYLITNEATTSRHAINPHYTSGAIHHRNPDHTLRSLPGPMDHPVDSRIHTTQPTIEDTIRSQTSEEQLVYGEWVTLRESIPTTEPSRSHRQRDSGVTKERRHRRKHHHQRHGGTAAAL